MAMSNTSSSVGEQEVCAPNAGARTLNRNGIWLFREEMPGSRPDRDDFQVLSPVPGRAVGDLVVLAPELFQVRAPPGLAVEVKGCERPIRGPVVDAVELDNVARRKSVAEGIEPPGEGQLSGSRLEPFAHDRLVTPQERRRHVWRRWHVPGHGLEQQADE